LAETTGIEPSAGAPATTERMNLPAHVIIGLAMGLVAAFTALAWPFAILTGIVIGKADVERRAGIRQRAAVTIVRYLAVTGGVLGMLVFGLLFGGLVSFVIAALAAFSERLTARASDTDQMIARIAIVVVAVIAWLVLAMVLHLNITFGGTNTTTSG
jgi:hypothetical protein